VQAPSGHLLIECDKYAQFDEQDKLGGLKLNPLSLPVVVEPDKVQPTAKATETTFQ